ncbi:MAG: hypothetical protein ABS976_04695, partial [Rhodococcus sp. (in: high G+C Gram-positive bacteria)]
MSIAPYSSVTLQFPSDRGDRFGKALGRADVVVTNHALLAIDALDDRPVLPEHDVVLVDEAHDLVDRVTSA